MNADIYKLATSFVSKSYIDQAQAARRTRERMIESLLSQRRLPTDGWDEVSIELFLRELSAMDSNNFVGMMV
jgi:O-phospho-L-seryl-tRNASec:L-selenocysteinyl-tRNA synthase